ICRRGQRLSRMARSLARRMRRSLRRMARMSSRAVVLATRTLAAGGDNNATARTDEVGVAFVAGEAADWTQVTNAHGWFIAVPRAAIPRRCRQPRWLVARQFGAARRLMPGSAD